jgi:murein DD-endopeptidase MepM/ murein hydrolase activator NlpD
MKWNHWIMVLVVFLLLSFIWIMAQQTVIVAQGKTIDGMYHEVMTLKIEILRLRESLIPPPFVSPLPGPMYVSSSIGFRTDPMGGTEDKLHLGSDYPLPIGTPVKSVASGVVVAHWPAPNSYWRGHPIFGGCIVIDYGSFLMLYGHLSKTEIHEGDLVKAGQKIGEVGDTGICTGPHLHLQVIVDPMEFLKDRRA